MYTVTNAFLQSWNLNEGIAVINSMFETCKTNLQQSVPNPVEKSLVNPHFTMSAHAEDQQPHLTSSQISQSERS